jgi:hypothetical protein
MTISGPQRLDRRGKHRLRTGGVLHVLDPKTGEADG